MCERLNAATFPEQQKSFSLSFLPTFTLIRKPNHLNSENTSTHKYHRTSLSVALANDAL